MLMAMAFLISTPVKGRALRTIIFSNAQSYFVTVGDGSGRHHSFVRRSQKTVLKPSIRSRR
jgi:hypothetical protein